jgi:YggT family protein
MEVLLQNFTYAVAVVLDQLLTLYLWLVVISALLTWVNPDPRNPIVRFLHAVTEPLFYEIRRRLPFVIVGGFDLSPLVVILGIMFLKAFVVRSLYGFAIRFSAARATVVFG